jgi:hypothetical protein
VPFLPTDSKVTHTELYNLTGYDHMNYDFPAFSDNIADDKEATGIVNSMFSQLRDAVATWY